MKEGIVAVAPGITNVQMADALELMFEPLSAAAFGATSFPAGGDPDRRSLKVVYNMVERVVPT